MTEASSASRRGRTRRSRRHWIRPALIAIACLALGGEPARAVLVIGGTGRNTSTPSGALQDSGWQFEGMWQGMFTGTAIAPHYFITAAHLGGSVGDKFAYNGTMYTTTQVYNDPGGSDLRIWQVGGTFASYAPLYSTADEVGKNLVVFGMGGPRGADINVTGTLRGWSFTGQDGQMSYGTNLVTGAGPISGANGQFLTYQFNSALGPDTASLSPGDSGGGVFILKNGVWQLAAVNYAVDGLYNTHAANDPNYKASDAFAGAIFDARGLYFDGDTTPIAPANAPNPVPATSYSTRISNAIPWILSVTGLPVPEPGSYALLAGGLALALPLWWKSSRSSQRQAV